MMRPLLRSIAVISVLSLPLIAHATTTYTGTLTVVDTSKGNETIGGNSFSFTDPSLLVNPFTLNTFDDPFSILGNISKGDSIALDVNFTSPGSGSGDITGDVFKGIFGGENIAWGYPAIDQIDLTNGSVAFISLPNFLGVAITPLSSSGRELGASSDLYITIGDNDPAVTPEPSSLMLLGTGVIGAVGMLRRRLAL